MDQLYTDRPSSGTPLTKQQIGDLSRSQDAGARQRAADPAFAAAIGDLVDYIPGLEHRDGRASRGMDQRREPRCRRDAARARRHSARRDRRHRLSASPWRSTRRGSISDCRWPVPEWWSSASARSASTPYISSPKKGGTRWFQRRTRHDRRRGGSGPGRADRAQGPRRAWHDHPCGRKLDADAVIDIPCDIWIPATRWTSSMPATSRACRPGSSPKLPYPALDRGRSVARRNIAAEPKRRCPRLSRKESAPTPRPCSTSRGARRWDTGADELRWINVPPNARAQDV